VTDGDEQEAGSEESDPRPKPRRDLGKARAQGQREREVGVRGAARRDATLEGTTDPMSFALRAER